MLLADDDPVIPIASVADLAKPDSLTIERTAFGGHCGFLDGFGFSSWLDDYVLRKVTTET